MRLLSILLAVLGLTSLGIAAAIAVYVRDFDRQAVVAPGVVTQLTDGPRHADVAVTPVVGARFVYSQSTERGLAVGEKVSVRYLQFAPAQTARLATIGTYDDVWQFALMGLAFFIAAAVSPWLVARFPGLMASPIR